MPHRFRKLDWTSSPETLTRSYLFSETKAFRFISDRGMMKTNSFDIGDAGVSVSRVASTGHEIELTETNRASLIIPTQGTIQVKLGKTEFSAVPTEALVFRPNQRVTRVVADPTSLYQAFVLMVPLHLIAALDAPDITSTPPLVDRRLVSGTPWLRLIEQHLNLVFSDLDNDKTSRSRISGPATADYLVELFDNVTVSDRDQIDGRTMRGSARVQTIAEEFIRANFADPLKMSEVAESAGVSIRRLQMVFRSVAGFTPHQALNVVRMEAAHRMLSGSNEDRSVTEIAYECGFTHLSRFAAAYRARYGQNPARTLRSATPRSDARLS